MDAATLSRLEQFEKEKKFYDALQFYRTKVTRSFRLKSAKEVAILLVRHALEFFFKENQYQCAIDIVTQYAECLSKNNVDMSYAEFELLAGSVAKFADFAEKENKAGNAQSEQLLNTARCKCVDLAIQWTKQQSSNSNEKKYGSSAFHTVLAKKFVLVDHLELAKNHFLLSDDSKTFAEFLHQKYGKERFEQDDGEIIIVEAVLQALCLDRFPFAVSLFTEYVKPNKYPFAKPLLNFQHILFDVIETENVQQYSELTVSYQNELKRSYSFIGYLTRIGKLYFGVRDTQCMSGGLGSLFSGLLGSQKEEETATSHITARTPARQKPAASTQPSSFAMFPSTLPTVVPPIPKKIQKVEVEEDLD
uniref:Alpha-SNAP n=1 Tax=Caenorhabditis tropicalis TaxID=1561998 RepID=A0A1I7U335_9PELO